MTAKALVRPLVFLDTETTSLRPDREVWEVGMIRRDTDGLERIRQFLVLVSDLATADPQSLQLGRFYERHPQGRRLAGLTPRAPSASPPLSAAVAAHEVAVWTHGAHLVCANPGFDAEGLDRLLRAHNALPAWHYSPVDVKSMAIGWLRARRVPASMDWKSDALAEACGVKPATDHERHTALGDARWVQRWHDTLTEGVAA